jgi:hypothetical protein
MDEPLRDRLRPARRCGLTSPDPVTALARPNGPAPGTCRQDQGPDTPQNNVSGRKTTPPETAKIITCGRRTKSQRQNSPRWIEA